ncbi:hypothetical protein JW921_01425, partial [Candidatus Fermentibacterales bacterium]|nr:hypothetical protein [Candidatus Fermentibacterales bacterium]
TGYVLDRLAALAVREGDLTDYPLFLTASANRMWLVGGSLPVMTGAGLVNRLPVWNREGELVHWTEKVHLFRQMHEDSAFIPGTPSGIFRLEEFEAAAALCYDLRFPEVFRRLVLMGAELIFVPAQWPARRAGLFRSLLRARAAEAQVFVVGCNLGGEHLGVEFGGGGGVALPTGDLLDGTAVSEGVTDFEIDRSLIADTRESIDCLSDRRPDAYGNWFGPGGSTRRVR